MALPILRMSSSVLSREVHSIELERQKHELSIPLDLQNHRRVWVQRIELRAQAIRLFEPIQTFPGVTLALPLTATMNWTRKTSQDRGSHIT